MTDQNKTQNYEPTNRIVLIGNSGAEAEEHTSKNTGESFVAMSLYTSNSYLDDEGNRQDFASTLHNIVAYDPIVMKQLLSFKAGVRLRIEGKLTYRTFEVEIDGQLVNKKEASIVAKKVEQAALPSKKKAETAPPAEMATS
ncbi:MAG: single-stranded DNA-binding protein [Reichenbachiella sp.]|uniref:single-stranded DNA-binding protein n=1 Tax=Reichenbachiella sp. TaxID=2184521 RepID=UPI00329786CA